MIRPRPALVGLLGVVRIVIHVSVQQRIVAVIRSSFEFPRITDENHGGKVRVCNVVIYSGPSPQLRCLIGRRRHRTSNSFADANRNVPSSKEFTVPCSMLSLKQPPCSQRFEATGCKCRKFEGEQPGSNCSPSSSRRFYLPDYPCPRQAAPPSTGCRSDNTPKVFVFCIKVTCLIVPESGTCQVLQTPPVRTGLDRCVEAQRRYIDSSAVCRQFAQKQFALPLCSGDKGDALCVMSRVFRNDGPSPGVVELMV